MAKDDELIFLAWNDLVGVTRGRGVPLGSYPTRRKTGINWAMAGQALTPFEDIADNPWGPLDEAHMTPVPETQIRVDVGGGQPPLNMVLCDGLTTDGAVWDSCTRGFCKAAVDELRRRTGLVLKASPELEFQLLGADLPPATPFSLEAFRLLPDLGARIVAALRQAGAEPESFEPEYGVGQYEVTCRPALGVAAADRMVIVREVIREVARRAGYRASFTPKPFVGRPGNGAHIHFSLQTADGKPVTHDPAGPGGLGAQAQRFAAGVVRHLPALCALTAPSVPSYYRLGPHHWSAGYACLGVSNREAALRICLPPKATVAATRRLYNLEVRPADSTASPYLALGALIRAGLAGIVDELPPPPLVQEDPHDMGADRRGKLGIVELPSSLGAALDCLERDTLVRGWFAPNLWRAYLAVKRKEIELMANLKDEDVCARYCDAY
ncbi:MAG TPA: glutamine synthetase family protein [Methylomirabilota bacterium]|nr:glutamine synthetase family protein [Methylomirabilota bacterium]